MYPTLFTTPGVKDFAEEIDAERQRQIGKFGEQHHPDIDPRDIDVVTHDFFRQKAEIHRKVNEERATPSRTIGRCGRCPEGDHPHTAWDVVLLEEVYEALAESDPAKLRTELIQAAAVCAAWIADIDSRTPAAEQPAACAKCRTPFDPADARFDGHAQHAATPYCRACVDHCRDTEIADHRCVICGGGQ